jgi:hypothetical protein
MNTENNKPVVVDQHGKAGRPTKYEPDTIGRLLVGLADGLPIKSACIIAGIGVSTLADWREKYPELEQRMAEAREKARQQALQRIKRAAKDDWRAAVAWLRLTFPDDYRRLSNTSVEVNTAVQTAVVFTEEERMRLIAQRERSLAEERARHKEKTERGQPSIATAPMTLPEPGAKLQTNIGVPNGILAANDPKPDSRPGSPWSMPAGAEAPSDASPVLRAWLEHERPEPET